jgi:spermidine/putrescine transport system permease protein
LLTIYSALVFAFIYLPIVILILYSFNRDGVGGFPPRHLTFNWYRQLFADAAIWTSVLNSLIVAACSVACPSDVWYVYNSTFLSPMSLFGVR